ncbi:uncharacterized protein LOC122261216 isoform X2 [Penaeus japonicus]|uniref:uncharacterized protein LOC122261216 isoform X2 n=1 Tax=Penaeus japonicus TaxID=27405 RepID=UPI001C70C00B|nr:uncharacterized protein LOC122261216 isoform X2 [Penaeus japonicus]
MRQMYPSLTLISGLFTVCTASTESINSGIKELPAEAWVAQRAAPLPPSELPAEAWLAQRAAHWANMYLPGRAPANSTCQKALRAMAESLAGDGTLWAAKFVDSWAKVPDGLYVGNWALEGVFDECISASSPDRSIRGKFCRVSVFDNATAGGQLRGDGGCGGGGGPSTPARRCGSPPGSSPRPPRPTAPACPTPAPSSTCRRACRQRWRARPWGCAASSAKRWTTPWNTPRGTSPSSHSSVSSCS